MSDLQKKLLVIVNARREYLDKLQAGITESARATYYELRRLRLEELPARLRGKV